LELSKVAVRKIGDREYMFELDGEDHTMGSLLQHYLQLDERVDTVYYSKPHPLEDKITVYVKLAVETDPIEVFKGALERIASEAKEFREKLLEAYKKAGVNIEG
jgi:DNA-directed RNA polymerase subunit L